MARVMFSSISSGSGKTTIVCAILMALKNRKINVKALKCGPDYIDAMYHREIGVSSGNLDSFFCDRDEILALADTEEMAIIEGAMGFYDGIAFTNRASAWEISEITDTPVILILDCRGMANSVIPVLRGFKNYQKNNIKGIIFNRVSESTYNKMADFARIEGLIPLGYMPENKEYYFKSRHLGLSAPGDIRIKLSLLAQQAEKTIDLPAIADIAAEAPTLSYHSEPITNSYNKTIAIARDDAFSFVYEDNIDMLREYGCNIVFFSPLRDKKLPKCDRLILSGGYPELYGYELSKNTELMADIKNKIKGGLKTIAECGGFIYLHSKMEGNDSVNYNMVGLIKGEAYKTTSLRNFGYFNMTAQRDNVLCKKGESLRIHEFHYWDSTNHGNGFSLKKPLSEKTHLSVVATDTLYAGFPHIYFRGNRAALENFLKD